MESLQTLFYNREGKFFELYTASDNTLNFTLKIQHPQENIAKRSFKKPIDNSTQNLLGLPWQAGKL